MVNKKQVLILIMIFKWLYIKKVKAYFLPNLPKKQLDEVFSDTLLTEWEAFCYFIRPNKKNYPEIKFSPEADLKFKEIVEISRQKQNADSVENNRIDE